MNFNYDNLQFNEVKEIISHYCSFSLGRETIMALNPSFNKLEVRLNNNRLKQALAMTRSYGPMPFGGIYDITPYVTLALKDGTLNAEELLKIADQNGAINSIIAYVKDCNLEKNYIEDLTKALNVYDGTANSIYRCISRSGEVADNASSELAKLRKSIKSLQHNIASKMASYINKHASYLQDDIITTRNGRSVILVKNTYKNVVSGLQYGTSTSGAATYIEPSEMIGPNNELQQAIIDEKREVQRILHHLSQLVKKDGYGYISNTDTLGLLDSIFAKARYGLENDGTVGNISENGDLVIEKGRHPLIDKRKVVANSYHIVKPVKAVLITGPNTGGKTVSLKVIGLFTIMFLAGLPLLCDEADIPVYDNVFTDIGDGQSISDDLSTFSAHIKKLAEICNEATNNSLVILDELGSGTDPLEGQALASAVLDFFRRTNVYVVATTHYSKLKAYGQQYDSIMLSSVEFDQINLKPTYRYLENSVGKSNAFEIAERYGLNLAVIEDAKKFKISQQSQEDVVLEKLQSQLALNQQLTDKLEAKEKQLQDSYNEFYKEKDRFENEKQQLMDKAKSEAYEIVEEAKVEAEVLIDELKQMKNYSINEVAQIKNRFNKLVESDEEEIVNDDDSPLKAGDYVKINLTNQHGEIVSLDKKKANVNVDGVKMSVSLANLVRTTRPKKKEVKQGRVKVSRNTDFHIECNLIGMYVEEALEELDKYLSQALVANVPYVRIIHGVGTGALRTAVWNKLKKYNFVKKYEIAPLGEGGTGATIVTLKG